MNQVSDDRIDAQLRGFLAARASDTATMPTVADVADGIAARPAPRLPGGMDLRAVALVVALMALLVLAIGSALLVGGRRAVAEISPVATANGFIAISANPPTVGGGEVGDIYLVGDGPARRIIGSDGDGVAQACPRFSPDGRWLAYGESQASAKVDNYRGRWPVAERALVVVAIDDAGRASPPTLRATRPLGPGQIACPTWSPDGSRLAARAGPELWVVDVASRQIVGIPAPDAGWARQELAWSHDGSRIAMADSGAIRVIDVESGQATSVPTGGDPDETSLSWTAGDEAIIFLRADMLGNDRLALHLVSLVDGQITQIPIPDVDPSENYYEPVLSPDGRRLVVARKRYHCTTDGCSSNPERLQVMDLDGTNAIEVPIPPDFDIHGLQWSPDGRRLLFGSISGVASVGVEPDATPLVHSSGELNLEWSGRELTWQPLLP